MNKNYRKTNYIAPFGDVMTARERSFSAFETRNRIMGFIKVGTEQHRTSSSTIRTTAQASRLS